MEQNSNSWNLGRAEAFFFPGKQLSLPYFQHVACLLIAVPAAAVWFLATFSQCLVPPLPEFSGIFDCLAVQQQQNKQTKNKLNIGQAK